MLKWFGWIQINWLYQVSYKFLPLIPFNHSFACLWRKKGAVCLWSPEPFAVGLTVYFINLLLVIPDKTFISTVHVYPQIRQARLLRSRERTVSDGVSGSVVATRGLPLTWVVSWVLAVESCHGEREVRSFCKCNGSSWIKWERQNSGSGEYGAKEPHWWRCLLSDLCRIIYCAVFPEPHS